MAERTDAERTDAEATDGRSARAGTDGTTGTRVPDAESGGSGIRETRAADARTADVRATDRKTADRKTTGAEAADVRATDAEVARGLVVGLLGAGAMARAHLPGWLALGARVVVLSAGGGAAALADRHRDAGVTTARDLDDLLARCAVVDVCAPTPAHRPLALAAIRAGRPVVCEKPLALTAEDAEEVARAAEDAGVPLFPAHVVRYFPAYAAAAEAVARGDVGTPASLRFTRGGAFPAWAPWFADPERSGGVLMDLMIHDLDFARLVAGEVTEVSAGLTERPATAPDGPLMEGTAVLTHASGAVSRVHALWGHPDLPFRTGFRITGPGGVLEHDSGTPDGSGETSPEPDGPSAESPYLTQLREFAVALAGGPPPRVSARDGVAAVRLATAAARSARTGRPVRLDGTRAP
ncbi:Gfo/Idh/MocA family protein [Streptomyces sp. JNUCC 64]